MRTFLILLSLTLVYGCNSRTTAVLAEQEKSYCDSLKIDSTIILQIKLNTDSTVAPFPTRLETILNKDIDIDSNRKKIQGLIFNSNNSNTDIIIDRLYDDFQKKGYTIFTLDENFGIKNKPDVIGVLKSVDKYQILKQIQTDGINWTIDNDSLLSIIKKFDEKYSLQLIGASDDWCEFKINKEPDNWLTFAKEAYKVCPDIVDQGTGTIEELAKGMKQTKCLYFGWD